MPQAVNSELLLYADDTCLIYMGKNIQKIEEQLNSDLPHFVNGLLITTSVFISVKRKQSQSYLEPNDN